MNDRNIMLINGKEYEHEYMDVSRSPVQESSAAPPFFWVFGFIVVVFVALYFFVPPVGEFVRITEAKWKARITMNVVSLGEPSLDRYDRPMHKYALPNGEITTVYTKVTKRFEVLASLADGATVRFYGEYYVAIDEGAIANLLVMYRDYDGIENQVSLAVDHVIREAALKITTENIREKFREVVSLAIANTDMPEGITYSITNAHVRKEN